MYLCNLMSNTYNSHENIRAIGTGLQIARIFSHELSLTDRKRARRMDVLPLKSIRPSLLFVSFLLLSNTGTLRRYRLLRHLIPSCVPVYLVWPMR